MYIYKLLANNYILQDRFVVKKNTTAKNVDFWFHGASIGEVLSVKSFIIYLIQQNKNTEILITIQSKRSYVFIKNQFAEYKNINIVFLPYDVGFLANKFLKFYNPKIVFWIEQEFLPNILRYIKKNNLPLILLNARMFDKSYNLWSKFSSILKEILKNFTVIYTMSLQDKEKYKNFTNNEVKFVGNLKYTNLNTHYNQDVYNQLKLFLKNKIVFLALSTHDNEEEEIIKIHKQLKNQYSNFITIIIPRHIKRAESINNIAQNNQISTLMFNVNNNMQNISFNNLDLIIVNEIGLVNTFIKLSNFVFVGKSLSKKYKGGHNIIEPLSLNSCLLFGPNMQNFLQIAEDCLANNCAKQVLSFNNLHQQLILLINNPKQVLQMQENTKNLLAKNSNILNNLISDLKCYINI